MSTIDVYDALRAAGVEDEKARKAVESIEKSPAVERLEGRTTRLEAVTRFHWFVVTAIIALQLLTLGVTFQTNQTVAKLQAQMDIVIRKIGL